MTEPAESDQTDQNSTDVEYFLKNLRDMTSRVGISDPSATPNELLADLEQKMRFQRQEMLNLRGHEKLLADRLLWLIRRLPLPSSVGFEVDQDDLATPHGMMRLTEQLTTALTLIREQRDIAELAGGFRDRLSEMWVIRPGMGTKEMLETFLEEANRGRQPLWISNDDVNAMSEALWQLSRREEWLQFWLWSWIPAVQRRLEETRRILWDLKNLTPRRAKV